MYKVVTAARLTAALPHPSSRSKFILLMIFLTEKAHQSLEQDPELPGAIGFHGGHHQVAKGTGLPGLRIH